MVRGAFVPPSAYADYMRGELALAHGQPAAAVGLFSLALTAPEVDPYVLTRLALAQGRSNDPAGAARSLLDAEHLSPCLPSLWTVRATLAAEAGDRTGALAAYRRALECKPDSVEAQRGLVVQLRALGANARADALEPAINANNSSNANGSGADSPSLRHALGQRARGPGLDHSTMRDAVEAAIARQDRELLRRLLADAEGRGDLSAASRVAGWALLGNADKVARAWADIAPSEAPALRMAAEAYLAAGWWPEAEASASAALGAAMADPGAAATRQTRGRARLAGGDTSGAIADVRAGGGPDAKIPAGWLDLAGLSGLSDEVTATRAVTTGGGKRQKP